MSAITVSESRIMITLANILVDTSKELLERLNGPLHFRLIIMPIVVSVLAVRAGIKDGRGGRPAFMSGIVTRPAERSRLLASAMADIGKIFVVAVVLDTAYQLMTGQPFRVREVIFVAVACAILPYIAIRGPVTLLTRCRCKGRSDPTCPEQDQQ